MDFKKKIELNKLANILIYLSENTKYFGITKANKLLYYIDCFHMVKYGRKVTSEIYKKLPQGPVPSEFYDRLKSIIELTGKDLEETYIDDLKNFNEYLSQFIDVVLEDLSSGKRRHRIIAKQSFDSKWFSKTEIEIITRIADLFKEATAEELSKKTHREPPYMQAEANGVIDLKLFAKDKVSAEQLQEIEYIEKISEAMSLNY